MQTVATFKKNEKTINIIRMVKAGTKRVFFYPETIEGKRLNTTLYARQYDAVAIGNRYLNN